MHTSNEPQAQPSAAAPSHAPNHDEIPTDLPKVGTRGIVIVAFVFILLLAALFAVGYIPHLHRMREAEAIAKEQDDKPIVEVVQPKRANTGGELVLPGDARAFQETALYPRATGYLKQLLVDIGDRVKAGQLLAVIEAPEIDAQLNEARAALEQAKTNVTKSQTDLAFAQTTLQRYESAVKTGAVTTQDVDEKRTALDQAKSAVDASRAAVAASEASVQRLAELQGFQKVYAPFGGVITSRGYDVGALLTAANSTNRALFGLAETDTLKVFVSVPQTYATAITNGQEATLEVRNFPGRLFKGKVVRSSGALDPATRTLKMEVDFPNSDDVLFAGMYGQVHLQIKSPTPPLMLPTSALVFDTDGTKVATVAENNKVKFQKILVGRDLGTELEVTDGLSGSEQVVSNPGERLADGVEVQIAPPTAQPGGAPSPAGKTQTAAAVK